MESNVLYQKKAFIVGGTSSIGLETARKLADEGCSVTVAGRHIDENDRNLFSSIILFDFEKEGFSFFDREDVKKVLESCDILVNCYGPFVYRKLHETSVEDWKTVAESDYAFAGALVSSVLKGMMERRNGSIILFGGTRTDSVKGYANNAAYAGAKTGIAVLVKSVSMEYGRFGICCNGIFPGFTRNAPQNTSIIQSAVIADKVVYLLKQKELNGVLLNVDRGWQPGL